MSQRSPLPLRIAGTGTYLPERVVASSEFERRFAQAPGTIERTCGVRARHVASAAETSSWMGARAAERALVAANLQPRDLDCIVSACSVMEQAIPCLAVQIQHQLGLGDSGIPAFDVNATCLSFLAALDLIACALAAGRYRRALIVSSEIASAGVDPDDSNTAPLFGDGAAAVVLTRSDDAAALLASEMATYGVGHQFCQVRAGGTRLRVHDDPTAFADGARFAMDGRSLFRLTSRHLPPFVARLLANAGVTLREIACFVPHQASGLGLDHIVATLDLPEERVVRILGERGNQVAASLPSALHEAIATGRLERGQLVALLGTGAGLSLGGAVLRY